MKALLNTLAFTLLFAPSAFADMGELEIIFQDSFLAKAEKTYDHVLLSNCDLKLGQEINDLLMTCTVVAESLTEGHITQSCNLAIAKSPSGSFIGGKMACETID